MVVIFKTNREVEKEIRLSNNILKILFNHNREGLVSEPVVDWTADCADSF